MQEEPILIFDNEEAVLVTDEDVERGHLEEGWILTVSDEANVPVRTPMRTLRSFGKLLEMCRAANGQWAVRSAWMSFFYQAIKVRVATDEVTLLYMRVANLRPGMVFMHENPRFCVCLPGGRVRKLGCVTGQAILWFPYEVVMVCCTSSDMSFILK